MQSASRIRPLALAFTLTAFSFGSVAHADGGLWSWFTGKKHKAAPAQSVSTTPPPPTYQALLTYTVSLNSPSDCDQAAAKIQQALAEQTPTGGVTVSEGSFSAKCDAQNATDESGATYALGTIQITYKYTSKFGNPGPELNKDIVGGLPRFNDQIGSEDVGIFPTYQSCQEAAANILSGTSTIPSFSKETGADSLGYYCEQSPHLFSSKGLDTKGVRLGPDRNYALVIYSSGPERRALYVYQNNGIADADEGIAALGNLYDLLESKGYPVVYPADKSQFEAQSEMTYIAYYARPRTQMGLNIQAQDLGKLASLAECQSAAAAWDLHTLTYCVADQSGDNHVLSLSLDTYINFEYSVSLFDSYQECMDQRASIKASNRTADMKKTTLCVLDDHANQTGQYRAQNYSSFAF